LVNQGLTLGELTRHLDVSKQAASQLVDTLVTRAYLQRSPDPVDRGRMTIKLTARVRRARRRRAAPVAAARR
jgi:DNA-binding MarR family transcriptional regulator